MLKLKVKLKKVDYLKTETKFVFATKEELDELEVVQMENSIGYLVYNQDEISERAIQVMKDRKFGVPEDGMTPSQILRGKIWNLWNEKFRNTHDEEEFYLNWMKHFGDLIENQL